MAVPYSSRFVVGAPPIGSSVTYTVPAGYRAVVRCISFTTGGTGGAEFWCTCAGAIIAIYASVPAFNTILWNGHQVLYAGEVIDAHVAAGGAFVMVSGYLLSE